MTQHDIAPDPEGAQHIPVLLAAVLDALRLQPGANVIDGTLGGGGHTAAFLQQTAPDGRVLGIDADPAAIRRVSERLASAVESGRLVLAQANFQSLADVARQHGFAHVDGILLDLGLSSFQLETAERGFSFQQSGPLDMRFDPGQAVDAQEIVNTWPEKELADILYRYGEEHRSRRIARYVVENRPIESTEQLAAVIAKAVGQRGGRRIHPATKTFQALRIAVNRELDVLESVLPQALELLRPGGRLAVISFHSLEDRIVKQWMQFEASDFVRDPADPYGGHVKQPGLQLVTRKPITADEDEIRRNRRSRSAKLRVAERPAG